MCASMAIKPSWFSAQWVMLAITILLFVLVALFVDLKPVVDENFFFSTSDPGVQQSKKVEQRFPSQPQLILAVSSHDITSQRYLSRLQRLTQKIQAIDEVTGVKSLTAGPKSTADALASPFGAGCSWRRIRSPAMSSSFLKTLLRKSRSRRSRRSCMKRAKTIFKFISLARLT